MNMTRLRVLPALLAATAIGFVAVASVARAGDLSPDEIRCQLRSIGGARVFVGAKLSCLRRCAREALIGRVPASDCRPPYGGATARCVAAREGEALQRLDAGSCARDCPECYAGGDCRTAAAGTVGRIEAAIDGLTSLVYCDDAGSPDGLTRDEQSCADHIAAELRRFALAKFQCLRSCGRHAGNALPANACTPPLETNPDADPATVACIATANARSAAHIDGTCERGNAKLECYQGATGTTWLGLAGGAVDVEATQLLCGSPGGAFVDR